MPRIISHTPTWLSRPSPGFDLFSMTIKKSNAIADASKSQGSQSSTSTARRIIAKRGTEVFVVVGNTIRWTDLYMLKNDWEYREKHDQFMSRNGDHGNVDGYPHTSPNGPPEGLTYKTLRTNVHEQIQQLIPSPNGDLLAVLTSHTVHIIILPESRHLDSLETTPIKVKTHTVGPTAHVLSQSKVISALWHPLGVNGNCLVTVTADAIIRVWEIKKDNRWCFDEPKMAIDAKKLRHGNFAEDDFSAPKFGSSRGFSVDALDMEVAAACFGGTGNDGESAWSPMTLWLAMSGGDVYALCPLLPTKWQPPSMLVPSLTTQIAAKYGDLKTSKSSALQQEIITEQYHWVAEIDNQEPLQVDAGPEAEPGLIFERPSLSNPIPKLQGPFHILPDEIEDDLELSDIMVMAPKLDTEELLDEDDDSEESDIRRLSVSVVCLLATNGRVHICIDAHGVEGQWLPKKNTRPEAGIDTPELELILLECLETLRPEELSDTEYPTFTAGVERSLSLFVTHSRGVFSLSLDEWAEKLENEFRKDDNEGSKIRIDSLTDNVSTVRERLVTFESAATPRSPLATESVVWHDLHLGYFLLTLAGEQPYAVLLDAANTPDREMLDTAKSTPETDHYSLQSPARAVFQPPPALFAESTLLRSIDAHHRGRYRQMMKEELRLSAATMDIMTEAHRVLSRETQQLGIATGAIFDRCEQLQAEMHDQLAQVRRIFLQLEQMQDSDSETSDEERSLGTINGHGTFGTTTARKRQTRLQLRIETATVRHERISNRHDALRRKIARSGARDLSDKEQAWIAEVSKMERSIVPTTQQLSRNGLSTNEVPEPWHRLAEVKKLAVEILDTARAVAATNEREHAQAQVASMSTSSASFNGYKVPPDLRKARMSQVMSLLDRETALVDAAHEKLKRLSTSTLA